MSERTIVYGSCRGEHSDYQVCAIFSTRDSAVNYINARVAEDANVNYGCYGGCEEKHPSVLNTKGEWTCAGCGYNRDHLFDTYRVDPFDMDPKEAK